MNPEELKHIAVLQTMAGDALTRLAAVLEGQDYTDGRTIFAEADPGDSMYFVLSGRVRIEKRTDAAGASRKTLTVIEPGDYFGEMSLFDQKPRSASAVAEGPTRTLRLSKVAFDELHGQGGQAGMSVLAAMIRTSSERIRRLSAHLVVYDEIGKAIGESKSLQELLDMVLSQLSGVALADWALLALRSQFSPRLEIRSVLHLPLTPAQQEAVADGKGFLAVALRDPRERLFADFDREAPTDASPRLGFETPSLLWVPISVERDLLGLIVLGGRQAGQFDLDAVNLIKGVARQTAQAILNARHREEEQARSRHARQFVRF
jgi:CRP-like cAMP-binding protein